VESVLVVTGSVADGVSTAAMVRADSTATVAAQVAGTILEMRLREGDAVRAGEVVARIDARSLVDATESARASVAAARQVLVAQEAIFARDKELLDGGAIAQQALDVSRARLEAVRSGLIVAERSASTAEVQLAYASVTAPFPGTVTARLAEPGDLAAPGRALYTIQRPGKVRVISKLSQEALARLRPGAHARFSWGGQSATATISRIFPALDATFLGSVESDLPAAPFGLPNGATLHAEYESSAHAGLVVPAGAILDGLNGSLIVRIANGKADPVPVRVAKRGESTVAIEGDVMAGDEVVVGLPSELMLLSKGTPLASSSGGRS
jgi:RND family efflux transporter MFP subunit